MSNEADPKLISWEEFEETYKPLKNPYDENASLDGFMLETYGEELARVVEAHKSNPDTVWTYLDGDDALYLDSGFSYVNRIGYVITEVPVEKGMFISIIEEDTSDYE